MGIGRDRARPGSLLATLDLTRFGTLKDELQRYRIDSVLRMKKKKAPGGDILGFVRGLRLSAQLIYALRDALSDTPLEVNWGHLLDDNGEYCSPECDVIVHKPGHVARWNGTEKPVMDFRFVKSRNAVAVISCKSFIQSVDHDYSKQMSRYLKNLYLFAECCLPSAVGKLQASAKAAGYRGFWYLYTWNRTTGIVSEDQAVWSDFLGNVRSIAGGCRRRR